MHTAGTVGNGVQGQGRGMVGFWMVTHGSVWGCASGEGRDGECGPGGRVGGFNVWIQRRLVNVL